MGRFSAISTLIISVIVLMLLTFGSTLFPWSVVSSQDHDISVAKTFSGNEVVPTASACLIVLGMALIAYHYAIGVVRKLVAAVLLTAGLATTTAIIVFLMEPSTVSSQLFRQEFHLLTPTITVKNMAYPWVGLILSVLLDIATMALLWALPARKSDLRDPSNSIDGLSRKEDPGERRPATGEIGGDAAIGAWDALNAGKDPTASL